MAKFDLGKQVGPLPLGAWIVVVGTGLGIAVYSRRDTSPEIVEDVGGVPGVGTGPGWTAIPPPGDAPDSSQNDPVTNEEWARLAINYLIAQGYDPTRSDQAVRKYLAVERLSIRETALITVALAKFGSPPQPLPPGPELPDPPNQYQPRPQPQPVWRTPDQVLHDLPRAPVGDTYWPSPINLTRPEGGYPVSNRQVPADGVSAFSLPVRDPVAPYRASGIMGGQRFSFGAQTQTALRSALESWLNVNPGVTGSLPSVTSVQNVDSSWVERILRRPRLTL